MPEPAPALTHPPVTPRSAGEIIDLALRENAKAEYVFMWISGSMAVVGLGLLLWSALARNGILAISGISASSICAYGMRSLWRIRTSRYALRLAELLLEKAATADEAANVLIKVVDTVFKSGLSFSSVPWLPREKRNVP